MNKLISLGLILLTVGCSSITSVSTITHKSKDSKMDAATGQCHCGFVKYKICGNIIKSSYCGCGGCRRASGTFKVPFVTVSSSNFVITSGKLAQFKSDENKDCDAHGTWNYCPKCGSHIAWISNDTKQTDIFAGTLSDPSLFKITEQETAQ